MNTKKIVCKFRAIILSCTTIGLVLLARPSSAYEIHDNGWDGAGMGASSLFYYYGALTADVPDATVKSTLASALNVWASVADLTFTQTFTAGLSRSLEFLFATGDHGDGFPFASDVLAHGFFPAPPNPEPIAGDVHFNDAFTWEIGNGLGTTAFDLMWVAVHEIGHALGLGHSGVGSAVMYPFVSSTTVFSGLNLDDISGIRSIYSFTERSAPVPEPATMLLFGTGIAGLIAARRKKKA